MYWHCTSSIVIAACISDNYYRKPQIIVFQFWESEHFHWLMFKSWKLDFLISLVLIDDIQSCINHLNSHLRYVIILKKLKVLWSSPWIPPFSGWQIIFYAKIFKDFFIQLLFNRLICSLYFVNKLNRWMNLAQNKFCWQTEDLT